MEDQRPPVTAERLHSLFRPRNVALVGASDKSVFSRMAFENLAQFGFGERTHLVNHRGVAVHGQATVRSCGEIAAPVDVAYLMVPHGSTIEALEEVAAAGIPNAIVLSSGYAETGDAGRAAQAELVAAAAGHGMLLLGPNSLGFANFIDGIPIISIPFLPERSGPVALISQSGASTVAMIDFATIAGIGLSHAVTVGNEAMISITDVLTYALEDERVRAVAIFMEGVRDPAGLRAAALRAAALGKAVVVLKAGSSQRAASTAPSTRSSEASA